jgi:hypothetical protein
MKSEAPDERPQRRQLLLPSPPLGGRIRATPPPGLNMLSRPSDQRTWSRTLTSPLDDLEDLPLAGRAPGLLGLDDDPVTDLSRHLAIPGTANGAGPQPRHRFQLLALAGAAPIRAARRGC